MTDLFFATYGGLALLTTAWKMHDALIKVVVHNVMYNVILMIELSGNSTMS